jgi:predicted ATP-grasp superfamily ATP-dependent carboligase
MVKKYKITEFGYVAGKIMHVTPVEVDLHKGIIKRIIDIYYKYSKQPVNLTTDAFIAKMVESGLLEEVK